MTEAVGLRLGVQKPFGEGKRALVNGPPPRRLDLAADSPVGPKPRPGAQGVPLGARVAPGIPDHQLLGRIGAGSYGEVWLARNVVGTRRAVKIIHRQSFEHDDHFEREFNGIKTYEPVSRSHPGLVNILQIGRNDEVGYFYYVMELADAIVPAGQGVGGGAESAQPELLAGYAPRTLRAEQRQRGRLPLGECVQIGLTLSAALAHLHQRGLVHRDVKPSNIIFVQGIPKLADIGLVAQISEAKSFVGTEGFIPPEGSGTPQADLYGLGKVLYEISMGRDRLEFPQLPGGLRELLEAEGLVDLNEVVLKACEPEPRRRYRRATDLHADLLLLQHGKSVHRLRVAERRLKVLTRLGCILAGLLAVGSLLYLGAMRRAHTTARQLYGAEINLAMQAWEQGNLTRARELLARQARNRAVPPGFEWRLVHGLCAGSEAPQILHPEQGTVWTVAVSPDGRRLVTGGATGVVKVWDRVTGDCQATLANHVGIVGASAFSPDGLWFATGGRDATVRVWDADSLQLRHTLRRHTDAVRAVAFSPDSRWLASGGEDALIVFWDPANGAAGDTLTDGVYLERLAFSPDGQVLVASGADTRARLWDVPHRRKQRDLELHRANLLDAVFSPDGALLATASFDGSVRLWDLRADREWGTRGRGAPARRLAFLPDGATLAVASDDNLVRLWAVGRDRLVATLRGHTGGILALAVSPDGQTLVTGAADQTVRLWDPARLPEKRDVLPHRGIVDSLAFAPDGQQLVSADFTADTLRWWDTAARQSLAEWTGPKGSIWCVAASPVAGRFAAGGLDGLVRLWGARLDREPLVLPGHVQAVDALAFSADGKLLASAGRDGAARLWDVTQPRQLRLYAHGQTLVRSVAFSPDQRTLATGARDGRVRLWELSSTNLLGLLPAQAGEIRSVAFTPDGRRLAAGGDDQTIRYWDWRQARELGRLRGHTAQVSALAFSPDGETLASGSWDSTIKLWSVGLQQELVTLREHTGQVTAVAFSPEGHLLASASADGTVRLWQAARSVPVPHRPTDS
ncbi:MAG: hypothetical protein FJ387_05765 [Verrucomicrobia bacterium]|nr:hypothetical protein [Verrucomicrobiota bacterium]